MNGKKIILTICLISTLLGCNPRPIKNLIPIPSSDEAGIHILEPLEVEKKVIDEAENSIILFSIESCPYCASAKEELENYAIEKGINVYDVDVTRPTNEERESLVRATSYGGEDTFVFPYMDAFPHIYLFMERYVAIVITEKFTETLDSYIEVV